MLAELPEFRGQAQHAALMRAMADEPAACDGLDVYTADRFDDPEQTELMRGICRACPLIELCAAFAATGKPAAGMWAGHTPAQIRRLRTPAAA
ncbi:WhiB family transcriptional regulator [Microbacterium sp. NPDC089318]